MPGRIVVIDDMLPDDMVPIVVIMVVVPAPGGGSGAGIPRPMLNPVVPENPQLSRSLFLSLPLSRAAAFSHLFNILHLSATKRFTIATFSDTVLVNERLRECKEHRVYARYIEF